MDKAFDCYSKCIISAEDIDKVDPFRRGRYLCPICYDEVVEVRGDNASLGQRVHFRHSKAQRYNRNRDICENYVTAIASSISTIERDRIIDYRCQINTTSDAKLLVKLSNSGASFYIALPRFSEEKIVKFKRYKYDLFREDMHKIYNVMDMTPNSNYVVNVTEEIQKGFTLGFYDNIKSKTANIFDIDFKLSDNVVKIYKEISSNIEGNELIFEEKVNTNSYYNLYPNRKYLIIGNYSAFIGINNLYNLTIGDKFRICNNLYAYTISYKEYSLEINNYLMRNFSSRCSECKQKYTLLWPPAVKNYNELFVEDDNAYVVSSELMVNDYLLNTSIRQNSIIDGYLNKIENNKSITINRLKDNMRIIGRLGDEDNNINLRNEKAIFKTEPLTVDVIDNWNTEINFAGYMKISNNIKFFNFPTYIPIDEKINSAEIYKANYLYKRYQKVEKDKEENTYDFFEILRYNKVEVRFPSLVENFTTNDGELYSYIRYCQEKGKINKIILEYLLGGYFNERN